MASIPRPAGRRRAAVSSLTDVTRRASGTSLRSGMYFLLCLDYSLCQAVERCSHIRRLNIANTPWHDHPADEGLVEGPYRWSLARVCRPRTDSVLFDCIAEMACQRV
jgi:hypothetical protein